MIQQESLDLLKDKLKEQLKKVNDLRIEWRHKTIFFKYSIIITSWITPVLLGISNWATDPKEKGWLALGSFVAGSIAALLNTIDSNIRSNEIYVHYCESLTLYQLLQSDIEFQASKGLETITEATLDQWHQDFQSFRKTTQKVWTQLRTTKGQNDAVQGITTEKPSTE